MNSEAQALGLTHTHYANPVGLDAAGNYSSAEDLAELSRQLLDNRTFARIAASRHAVLHSVHPALAITTRNTLLLDVPWVNGIKTGHTLGAGYVLVASGRRKGVELISTVLGTPAETDRDDDSLQLLDYGFSLYGAVRPARFGQQFADPQIRYSGDRLPLLAAHSLRVGVRRGQRLRIQVVAPNKVTGPIVRGALLGRAIVTLDGRQAAVVSLVAARAVPLANTIARLRGSGLLVAVLALLGGLAAAMTILARLARRRRVAGAVQDPAASREDRQRAREQRRRRHV
jgi:serine-type D-Ala-D-Ala carboxypeptidase (penicillin-binding protein 5/6)